jgi:hypothetical protein
MASKKKKNEFIEKQIKIKQQFADKVYKKMRADRYGLTFCCPNELSDTDIKNYTCNWQSIKYEPMPEEYKRTYSVDPIPNYCAPPGTFNSVTGLCDAEVEQIYVPGFGYSFADSTPNGVADAAQASNIFWFGVDSPIIFSSVPSGSNGNGNGAQFLLDSWWTSYNATETGPDDQQVNNDITEISFVNALGKNPVTGWDEGIDYTYAVPIQLTATTTLQIGVSALTAFRIETVTAGVTTTLVEFSEPVTLIAEISNAYVGNGGSAFMNTYANLVNAQNNDAQVRAYGATTGGYEEAVNASRFWIYPITLDAGCHTIRISAKNQDTKGMLAAFILNNSLAEMVAAESRSDLTELWTSEQMTYLYTEIDSTTPWTCQAPFELFTGSPYSESCPGCRMQGPTTVLECPLGYTFNETTQVCEGTFSTCDTETLKFQVVNQNGDPMSDYDIIFDGGNYTTNSEGEVDIVIEQASVNTDHLLNMCHCITTAGGCAVQNIKVTVTDPDVTTCTYNDPICKCQAPAQYQTQVIYPTSGSANLLITFQDLNLSNTANTIESYVLEYRQYTEAGDGAWTSIGVVKPTSGTTFTSTLTGLTPLITYEYRIKTICTESESSYSAIYDWVSTDIVADENLILWYDFTDATSMFTDLGGTTNVANDGDSVRRVNNKSQSTNKLGIFARDFVGSGISWTNGDIDFTQSPKYDTSGANGLSFLRQYNYTAEGNINGAAGLPLMSRHSAGFGGVNDGVALSNLTDLNSQAITSIMVLEYTNKWLNGEHTGISSANRIGSVTGFNTTLGSALYSIEDWEGGNLGATYKKPRHSTFKEGGVGQNLGFVNNSIAGIEILVRRRSPIDSENIYSKNTVNEASGLNEVLLPGAPDAWTVDMSTANDDVRVLLGTKLFSQSFNLAIPNPNTLPIYEYMVWNKTLSDSELNAIVGALKTKYGVL